VQYYNSEKNSFHLPVISNTKIYSQLVKDDPRKELVNLENFIPGILMDIRYASCNNFTRKKVYPLSGAFARKPVAEAFLRIQQELNTKGIGLKIYDAYRPYNATVKFFKICPDTNFCAPPWTDSKHNRGCAVDLTLIDLKSGKELEMPTTFDYFTEKASHFYMELTPEAIKNRKLLKDVMIKYGFTPYNQEWWHYNFKGWESYDLMDISFEELNSVRLLNN
jgi:D-alanyl-D-alanine dipeptidase